MSGERVERRLAAILAADVAGYSRLIGADEEGTLAALRELRRELIDSCIAGHKGRIVKTTGDGLLAEFASVIDALRCADSIQRAMAKRNEQIFAEKRFEFRIGIHQGDVVWPGSARRCSPRNASRRRRRRCGWRWRRCRASPRPTAPWHRAMPIWAGSMTRGKSFGVCGC
jgi:hypothetical protein